MSYSNEEKETLLRYDYIDKKWHAYSNIEGHINKMTQRNWHTVRSETENGRVVAAEFEADKQFVTFGDTKRAKRNGNSFGGKQV